MFILVCVGVKKLSTIIYYTLKIIMRLKDHAIYFNILLHKISTHFLIISTP